LKKKDVEEGKHKTALSVESDNDFESIIFVEQQYFV